MSCLYFFVMHAPPSHMTIAIGPEDICTVLLILVTFRCLCCSFCACCAFTTMAMITWPLYLKMLALFFSELDEFLSACCRSWDESLNLMTWCGIQSLPLRWKLTTEEIVPPRPAVSSVATGFGRSSFNSFSFNLTRTVFQFFACHLIQQQHLKRLEACFWIWEWFRSRDGNALYPYVKCPKCFSETINKKKQPLRLNYQYYKLSRITAWDPRKIFWYVLSCYN